MNTLKAHLITMVIAGLGSAFSVFSFYELKFQVLSDAYDKKYNSIEKMQVQQGQQMLYYTELKGRDFEGCLSREKKLATQLWVLRKDKRKNLDQLLKLNKQRYLAWQRKKKQEHLLASSIPSRSMAIIEKSPIEFKSEFLTLSEAIGGDSMGLRLRQSMKFPSTEWFPKRDRTLSTKFK